MIVTPGFNLTIPKPFKKTIGVIEPATKVGPFASFFVIAQVKLLRVLAPSTTQGNSYIVTEIEFIGKFLIVGSLRASDNVEPLRESAVISE